MKSKIKLLFIINIIILSLAGCDGPNVPTSSVQPTPILFTSIHANIAISSGNMLYGPVVASDGINIYYPSKDSISLIKSDYDGSEKEVLSDKIPTCINYINSKIFFISGGPSGPIYKVDTDGNGETMVTDDQANCLIATVSDVYYISSKDGYVYRIAHDGSDKRIIFPMKADRIFLVERIMHFIPKEDPLKVYFLSEDKLSDSLSGTPLDIEEIPYYESDIPMNGVNVSSGNLYFMDEQYKNVYRSRINERPLKLFPSNSMQPFIINQNLLFYVDHKDNKRLYYIDLDGKEGPVLIANDSVGRFAVIGNSIYYSRPDDVNIYRVSVAGGESERIS